MGQDSTSPMENIIINNLVDMDWKFGVVAASSEIKKVGSTFLQLQLVLDKGSGEVENITIELTLAQFYSFLHEIERAKAALEVL